MLTRFSRSLHLVGAAVAALVLALLVPAAPAQAQTVWPPDNQTLSIRNAQSSYQCVRAGYAAGDATTQYYCYQGQDPSRQPWKFQPAGTNGSIQFYKIVNEASGQCLDVYNGSTAAGMTLIQWPCRYVNDGSQRWFINHTGDVSQFVNANSGLCMDTQDGSTAPNTRLIQWMCYPGSGPHYWAGTSQAWTLFTGIY